MTLIASNPAGAEPEIFHYGESDQQVVELWAPHDDQTPRGFVILVHGGYWRAEYDATLMHPLAYDLLAKGWAVANIEYRSVGNGGGWPITLDDVRAAVRSAKAARPQWCTAGPVINVGHSVGGQLALLAADLVDAVVGLAPLSDVKRADAEELDDNAALGFMGGTTRTCRLRMTRRRRRLDGAPDLVLHLRRRTGETCVAVNGMASPGVEMSNRNTSARVEREGCVAADAADSLSRFRGRFILPEGVIYLDGNSLGPRPIGAMERVQDVVTAEWGQGLIRSWNTAGWFDLPSRLGDKLAQLIGGSRGETVVTDTTSLNLFKALASAIRIQQIDHPERRVIVTERDNFPSDIYIAEGIADFLNSVAQESGIPYEVRLIDDTLPLKEALDEQTAVIALSHVNYRTGAMWDMAAVTTQAHNLGALAIWDLAHSAGAVKVDLTEANADYAVGCTYKYLNGGPGSPGFIWVSARHQDRFWQPLSGWWSHAKPFAMADVYTPANDINRFLCGTQPITALALVETGLDIMLDADADALRAKSLDLTDLFISLVEQRCGDHPLELITPRDHATRGSHVSFRHPEGYAVMSALIARGVIGDYREPELLRFGITPLYLGYADIWDAVEILRDILDTRAWDTHEHTQRNAVT